MAILKNYSSVGRQSCGNAQGQSLPVEAYGARAALRTMLTVFCLVMFCSVSTRIGAQPTESTDEYRVKTAFLFNFAKFVDWPDSTFANSSAPLKVCILGNDPFGSSLDAIAAKTIKGRSLVIKRLRSVDGIKDCQMLYVSPNQLTQTAEIVHTLQKAPILTICDVEDCAEAGIMLNMLMVENRVHLEMNLDAVEHTPLKVSSQLIKLTRIVKRNE